MDYFRQRYRDGLINAKTYEKMMEIVYHLEDKNYKFVETLGEGTSGAVIKVRHTMTDKVCAVKIVSKDHVSEGETVIWSTLDHNNILPLLSYEYVHYANSYVFLTPVHPTTLEKNLFKTSFVNDKNSFNQAIIWLRQTLDAVSCLHGKNLSHLDIKCNNVLISEDKNAVLADFGFVTSSEKPVQRYGAPLLYRCPEGWVTEFGNPELDAQKFDVWSLGTLAFEMFTKMSLLVEVSKWKCPLSSWYDDIYPLMRANLQKDRFTDLMRNAFPTSHKIDENADKIISFIKSCLIVLPEKRPSVHFLQQHEIFGGSFKNVELENEEDIWSKTTGDLQSNSISEINSQERQPEFLENSTTITVTNNNNNKEIYAAVHSGEIVNIKENQFKMKINTPDKIVFPEEIKQNSEKLNDEYHSVDFDPTFEKDNQFRGSTNKKSNVDNKIHSTHTIQVQDLNPDYIFSSNISNEVITNENVDIENSVPEPTPNKTRCQIIRKWWKQRKTALSRFFTACYCCAKTSHTDKD